MPSVVDNPKNSTQIDLLDISRFTNGLIAFIHTASTPITIGIQGEWGSGKTSLLNTIRAETCERTTSDHLSIWLNTWEYSLLSNPEETLVKIVFALINELEKLTKKQYTDTFKKLALVGKGLLSRAVDAGGGIGLVAGITTDIVNAPESSMNIRELRETLEEVIKTTLTAQKKKSVIFFIDDLDRLEPSVAVRILELIKNLFDIEHCIFILAIDYAVVVKGLQSKFGEMTPQNEWEFRAFFDKIIQLPFSMPISSYNITKYLQHLLVQVQYFSEKDLQSKHNQDMLTEIVSLTVGTNPRALKRMANSAALIELIRDTQKIKIEERMIEFALICMQISYPLLYNLVRNAPNFLLWNEAFVHKVIKNTDFDIQELQALKDLEEFDEQWEQNLWKICQLNVFLSSRVHMISRLFNLILEQTPVESKERFGEVIERLVHLSAVTSVDIGGKIKGYSEKEGIFYINVGEGVSRDWDDFKKFGFVSAGGGERYISAIKKCQIGDIIVSYLKGMGFVGVGRIIKQAVPFYEFKYEGELLQAELMTQPNTLRYFQDENVIEWLAQVEWIKTFEKSQAKWIRSGGLYTTTHVRASLHRQPKTIEFINQEFDLDLHALLNEKTDINYNEL